MCTNELSLGQSAVMNKLMGMNGIKANVILSVARRVVIGYIMCISCPIGSNIIKNTRDYRNLIV